MPESTSPLGQSDAGLNVREEYLVVGAPGWPGGYKPWPPTLANARGFVRLHGGELRRRIVSDWEPVPDEQVDDREIMCIGTNRGGTASTARPRHQEVES